MIKYTKKNKNKILQPCHHRWVHNFRPTQDFHQKTFRIQVSPLLDPRVDVTILITNANNPTMQHFDPFFLPNWANFGKANSNAITAPRKTLYTIIIYIRYLHHYFQLTNNVIKILTNKKQVSGTEPNKMGLHGMH